MAENKYRPTRNEAMGEAFRELRKGSRTAPHADGRNKRARTRSASKRRAVKDGE